MVKSEQEFSNRLMVMFKRNNFVTKRIETASTVTGFPDMYIIGYGDDYFLELKHDARFGTRKNEVEKVAWRPGQVGFAMEYYLQHVKRINEMFYMSKRMWTLVSSKSGVYMIPMDRVFKDNEVNKSNTTIIKVNNLKDIIRMLLVHTYELIPKGDYTKTTWEQYITFMIDAYSTIYGINNVNIERNTILDDVEWEERLPEFLNVFYFKQITYKVREAVGSLKYHDF